MTHIMVSEEQAAIIAQAGSNVQVRDPQGRLIGFIKLAPSDQEIAKAKERLASGPGGQTYTTAQVLDHLRSLGQ